MKLTYTRYKFKNCTLMNGYSFLEIMISLCLLSFGLLGFIQAQMMALRTHQSAYLQSIAQIRLSALAEITQACAIAKCSSTSLRAQVAAWNIDNANLLPKGNGNIANHNNSQSINIRWQSSAENHFNNQATLFVPVFHDLK